MTSHADLQPLAPARVPRVRGCTVAAVICALTGAAVFQFFGNANHGYIDTSSLFWWWGFQWWNPQSETQHGWLVLAIAGWLLWRNLGEESGARSHKESPVSKDAAAPAVMAMLAGLALHTVGFAAQQARLSIVALLLFTWGVLRLGGGRRWGAATAFPLAFLVFAMPLNVLDSVGFWLRLWVIRASAAIAHLVGIAVVESGTQLMAPDGRYNYDVAAACSGVRSLMALAALSLLIGYLNFRSWWKRALMLLLCFPLVYAGNVARITAIIFAAQAGGPKWGDIAHETMGYAVFVIVLGGVYGAAAWLARMAPKPGGRQTDDGTRKADGGREMAADGRMSPATSIAGMWSGAIVAGIVVVFAAADTALLHRLAVLPPRGEVGVALAPDGKNPVELPALLGRDWVGWPAAISTIEREVLPADTGYSRINYVPSRGSRAVFLSIVLSGRDRTSIHRPELCLVGQGWTISGETSHRFRYPGQPGVSIPATVLHVQRQIAVGGRMTTVPQLVVYWFVGGDTVVATHWQRLLHDGWNRVVHARADRWAYVLLQTDASDGDAAALARLQSVLDGTLPTFEPMSVGELR